MTLEHCHLNVRVRIVDPGSYLFGLTARIAGLDGGKALLHVEEPYGLGYWTDHLLWVPEDLIEPVSPDDWRLLWPENQRLKAELADLRRRLG